MVTTQVEPCFDFQWKYFLSGGVRKTSCFTVKCDTLENRNCFLDYRWMYRNKPGHWKSSRLGQSLFCLASSPGQKMKLAWHLVVGTKQKRFLIIQLHGKEVGVTHLSGYYINHGNYVSNSCRNELVFPHTANRYTRPRIKPLIQQTSGN